jgi:hypothetical protein
MAGTMSALRNFSTGFLMTLPVLVAVTDNIVGVSRVHGDSMLPSLKHGDIILVAKYSTLLDRMLAFRQTELTAQVPCRRPTQVRKRRRVRAEVAQRARQAVGETRSRAQWLRLPCTHPRGPRVDPGRQPQRHTGLADSLGRRTSRFVQGTCNNAKVALLIVN